MRYDEMKYAFLYLLCLPVITVIFIVMTMLLSGCGSQRHCTVMEKAVTDSIVIRDTVCQVELVPYKDSVSIKDTASFLCNPYAYSYASFRSGLLNHSLGIYPFAKTTVKVPYFIDRTRRVEVPKPYPVERKLTRWESVKQNIGGYAIYSMVAVIFIFFGKIFYKIKKGR